MTIRMNLGAPVDNPEQLRQALDLFREPLSPVRTLGPDTAEARAFAAANAAVRNSMRGRILKTVNPEESCLD